MSDPCLRIAAKVLAASLPENDPEKALIVALAAMKDRPSDRMLVSGAVAAGIDMDSAHTCWRAMVQEAIISHPEYWPRDAKENSG